MIEERTQPTGTYISYTTYFFVQFFYIINYSLRDPIYIRPVFFTFATPFRDSHSRLTFTTHIHDSRFTTPIATPFSGLLFGTTLVTHIRDSCSRPHSRLPFATPDCAPNRDSLFSLSRLPSCDSTTD